MGREESSTKVADRYADQIGNAFYCAKSYTHPYSDPYTCPNIYPHTSPNANIDSIRVNTASNGYTHPTDSYPSLPPAYRC
jgi:hypothetical protein